MHREGPIIYLEDDPDDQELLKDAFDSLNISNELKLFANCKDALLYLKTTDDRPFLIITDVNLPEMSGIEMRRQICNDIDLKRKTIPYIFLSTSTNDQDIQDAYDLDIQGYFQKENTFPAIQSMLMEIIAYWKICKHPPV